MSGLVAKPTSTTTYKSALTKRDFGFSASGCGEYSSLL